MGLRYTTVDRQSWKTERLPKETGTLLVNVSPDDALREHSDGSVTDASSPSAAVRNFLLDGTRKEHSLVKLLLPVWSGYVVQSDFLERRMVDCLNVTEVRGFVVPGQHVQGLSADAYESMSLSDLLSYCYGAVVMAPSCAAAVQKSAALLDEELTKRLSFAWLSPNPIPRKRLAFVGAAPLSKFKGYAAAAAALNIALVVLDVPEQVVARDEYAHLREEFVPVDLTADAGLARRLADAVSEMQGAGKRFDGIMSVDEHLLGIVSQAATLLGFPTSPPAAIALAQNKFQTRQLDDNAYARLLRSPADLEALLAEKDSGRAPPPYPLIVKPCKGWSSEGVWKVANERELRARVPMLWQDLFADWHGREFVVEAYVDGPEVDANMALVDGEVAFFEVNDDFPSSADNDDDGRTKEKSPPATFVETSNMLPSALAASELEALRRRLHEIALAVGFRDGVLHMEARLRNSSSHYAREEGGGPDGNGGLVDLRPKVGATASSAKPEDVFLIEINPRPPGWQEVEATAHAYGVSYYSLAVLNAVGDRERFAALSRPFVGGAQYHMQLLFVSAQKGGTYRSGDVCAAVLDHGGPAGRRLREHVVKCATLMQDGQEVPDPRTGKVFGSFIAFFLVVSRTSRREAIGIGREIEQLVRAHTDGF
ncbi:Putative ATP-grasp, subdomain 1 protein [Colletotrichum destructivum]|uniref:ATP-grasp, subdomain 1 protein n=1 Tax=Colletotrichum destructivum TaxID=34406 RepID=A0AAX4IXN7_9PEZI|nr:Putative ATP-grasp, subdomain 1 protein [Colletotrichum destructivum]